MTTDSAVQCIAEQIDQDSLPPGWMAWWAKGHHDFGVMHEACGRDYGRFWDDIPHDDMEVTHHWWRVIPVRNRAWDLQLIEAEPGSRGAFPATKLVVMT